MNIKEHIRCLPDRAYDSQPQRNIRNKETIHDIDMQPLDAALLQDPEI